jgi:GT2 family glycosyltransferase
MATGRWTAIVINYNGASYLDACLRALERATPRPAEIVVVDNASTDDSLQELHAFPRVNVLAQPRNLGFAGGANVGLATVETDYAVLLNPDVEVAADFGVALQAVFDADARLGAAGPLLLYPDGATVQHAGGAVDRPALTTRHRGYGSTTLDAWQQAADVDFVTGGAMALRLAAVRAVGGFDERFSPVYYEDVDLCVRLRDAGWAVRYVPTLRALHHEGVTLERSADYFHYLHANRLRFALKHLTPAAWRDEFVPAEAARLRHELATIGGVDWARRSGATAIADVARAPRSAVDWTARPVEPGAALTGLREAIEAAGVAASGPPPPRYGRGRGWLRAISPAWHTWAQDALTRQQHANAALLAALDIQEQLNREQTALALTLALALLNRLELDAPRDESPTGSGPAL